MIFSLLLFFKGKRFEDMNEKQLSRLQRQRSHLFKEKLAITTLYYSRGISNTGGMSGAVGTRSRGGGSMAGSRKTSDSGEFMSDIDTSEVEAQYIVDSLERIIDDCRNLDLCPLCMYSTIHFDPFFCFGSIILYFFLCVM